MQANLETTNVLLGIMAAVSVLEGLLLVGLGVAGWLVYRRLMGIVNALEERHVASAMKRVNESLDDVKDVSAKVREETERVDQAIRTTIDRVDDTADRVRSNVRAKTGRVIGIVRGLRAAIEELLHTRKEATEGRS